MCVRESVRARERERERERERDGVVLDTEVARFDIDVVVRDVRRGGSHQCRVIVMSHSVES